MEGERAAERAADWERESGGEIIALLCISSAPVRCGYKHAGCTQNGFSAG